MAYADELRVGERCIVTDLRTGKNNPGVIEQVPGAGSEGRTLRKAVVLYDSGGRYSVDVGFITLTEEGDDRS